MQWGAWHWTLFLAVGTCAAAPRVRTSSGLVEGSALPGANEFLGVPFAEPTRRFEPPEDYLRPYAEQPLQATDFGPACMQVGNSAAETYGSEDCLYANVWQPSGARPGDGLPVIVFIYGGSMQFGEPEPYNGSAMAARHGVVYASLGYRTGPLGWMAFEEDSRAGRSTGNLGLLDAQSGLRWVQREIAAFGGDPSRVTIHGQSSGAMLVELHLVMPGSCGLLSGIVSQSGGLSARRLAAGINTSRAVGSLVGCRGPRLKACLQRLPALQLTNLTYSFAWGPIVDGVAIPDEPVEMLRRGVINPVSVMMGGQTNDTLRELSKQFLRPDGSLRPLLPKEYRQQVVAQVGAGFAGRALARYPADAADPSRNVNQLSRLGSDRMLCGIRRRLSLVNKHRPGQAFMYRFNWWYQSNRNCTAEPNYHPPYMGSSHEDEVTFVMGQPIFMFEGSCCGKWGAKLAREPCPQTVECTACWQPAFGNGYHAYFNDKEWAFSALVGGFWASFAATGSPNGHVLPGPKAAPWPAFTDGGPITRNIVLDADLPGQHAVEETLYNSPSVCAFWDSVDASASSAQEAHLSYVHV